MVDGGWVVMAIAGGKNFGIYLVLIMGRSQNCVDDGLETKSTSSLSS